MRTALPAVVLLLASGSARADEGMWLFNDFPSDAVKKAYGFAPDQAWLDRVRLGSVRLANGCSASIVSPDGLVMTNHHCIRACVEDLSTKERPLLETGFAATSRDAEEKCAKVEANQLVAITDVTQAVLDATKGASGADYQAKLKAEQAKLESACAKGDASRRCDVVSLFHGARFHLYEYRRFQDVRLVFAPEFQMATFGGDPDNFNFPRYGFDAAFVRLYVDGKPAATPERLKWAPQGAKEGDLVFVSGHPGGTERSQTVAQLELQRDVVLPFFLLSLAEYRGRLSEWMKHDPERERVAKSRLRSVENGLKALRGRREALVAPGFLDGKREEEARLKAAAPEATRGAWDAVAKAVDRQRALFVEYQLKEGGQAFQSDLFQYARALARYAAEVKLPNEKRLREYSDAKLPALKQQVENTAPISKDLEKASLAWSLSKLRETLGADDAFVKKVLGKKSPEALAAELIDGTSLADPAVRKALWAQAGKPQTRQEDVLLAFARRVDADARAVRTRWEDEVDAVLKKNGELLAEARRAVQGATGYPDATFTLRLSFGQVRGWGAVKPLTTVGGLFERATGAPPFVVTPRWEAARAKLPPGTPFNVATTNDIIGGNSGSPLLDRKGDVVGLVFDGNLPSLGGRYGYDARDNRTVAVHGDLILLALERVYGAKAVADELRR
ncbi:MAG: S46 family peptidase [Myxococcota bacterium]